MFQPRSPSSSSRRPAQSRRWTDRNARDALVWLILEDQRSAPYKRKRPWLPTSIYRTEIASFLRFEESVPLLYALGGRQGDPQSSQNTKLSAVEVFDSWSKQWRMLPPMSVMRVGAASCPIGEYGVFVAGGYSDNPGDPLNTTEEFDPVVPGYADGRWKPRAPMRTRRYGLVLLRAQTGDIYAIGGSSGQDVCSTVERYIPSRNIWINCGPLPEPLAGGRGVEIDGKLLYVGGFVPNGRLSNRIHIYDPSTDVWTVSKVLLSLPRTTFAMAVDTERGYLLVAGGQAPAVMALYPDHWYQGVSDHFSVSSHVEELSLKDIFDLQPQLKSATDAIALPDPPLRPAPPALPKNRTGCLGTYMKDHGFIVIGGEEEGAAPQRDHWANAKSPREWREAIVLNNYGTWGDRFPQPNQPRVAFGLVQTMGFPRLY